LNTNINELRSLTPSYVINCARSTNTNDRVEGAMGLSELIVGTHYSCNSAGLTNVLFCNSVDHLCSCFLCNCKCCNNSALTKAHHLAWIIQRLISNVIMFDNAELNSCCSWFQHHIVCCFRDIAILYISVKDDQNC